MTQNPVTVTVNSLISNEVLTNFVKLCGNGCPSQNIHNKPRPKWQRWPRLSGRDRAWPAGPLGPGPSPCPPSRVANTVSTLSHIFNLPVNADSTCKHSIENFETDFLRWKLKCSLMIDRLNSSLKNLTFSSSHERPC